MKTTIKIFSVLLTLMLTLTVFTACINNNPPPEKESTPENVNVMVLNGTTGFGMAKLISDNKNGTASLPYTISVETDASNITASLVSGACDIAALPTNAAANVALKTNGGVKVIAINTLGVLYVMNNTEKVSVSSFEDLRGKTVYCPAQNPTFLFKAICEANGLKVGEDIIIDNTYAQPADLRTALASGLVDIAVLPEPMVTIAKSANAALAASLDLTAEWEKHYPANSLMQGCVVVRTEFANQYPEAVQAFLNEYKASIEFVNANPADASGMIVEAGIFAQAPVAAKAIPNSNICYIDGAEMKAGLQKFYEILYAVAPASIGGQLPADDFYYVP
jgi:NitT/TauT family transport system substrate-binding protein